MSGRIREGQGRSERVRGSQETSEGSRGGQRDQGGSRETRKGGMGRSKEVSIGQESPGKVKAGMGGSEECIIVYFMEASFIANALDVTVL